MRRMLAVLVIGCVLAAGAGVAAAADMGTKDEAVAMVKKAVDSSRRMEPKRRMPSSATPKGSSWTATSTSPSTT